MWCRSDGRATASKQSLREALDARIAVNSRPAFVALVKRRGEGGVHRGSVELNGSDYDLFADCSQYGSRSVLVVVQGGRSSKVGLTGWSNLETPLH